MRIVTSIVLVLWALLAAGQTPSVSLLTESGRTFRAHDEDFQLGATLPGRAFYSLAGVGVFATDGTSAGTHQLTRTEAEFLGASDRLVFFTTPHTQRSLRLWFSDGTPTGTRFVMRTAGGDSVHPPDRSVVIDDQLVFFDDTAIGESRLLAFGEDSLEPIAIATMPVGDSPARLLGDIGSMVLFTHEPSNGIHELWATDTTTGATRKVTDLPIWPGDDIRRGRDRVYFNGFRNGQEEVWAVRGQLPPRRASGSIRSGNRWYGGTACVAQRW